MALYLTAFVQLHSKPLVPTRLLPRRRGIGGAALAAAPMIGVGGELLPEIGVGGEPLPDRRRGGQGEKPDWIGSVTSSTPCSMRRTPINAGTSEAKQALRQKPA